MEKHYIGKGNNLGNENSTLEDYSGDDLYYTGDLQSIIDRDWRVKLAVVRSLGLEPELLSNNEYIEWCESIDFDEVSAQDCFNKRLECSNGKYDKEISSAMEALKEKYAPMFVAIESMYKRAVENGSAEKIAVSNGRADLSNKVYLEHRIPMPTRREELDSRRELGILASEWFGSLEKFSECRFCSSFTAFEGNESLTAGPKEKSVSFIFDTQSDDLKKLLHVNYFRFQRLRKKGDLSSYSKGELRFLTQLDEWSNMKNVKDGPLKHLNGKSGEDVAHKHPNWVAVPGGIPSKYIVGIMLHGVNPSELEPEIVEALQEFNCPIFDESYVVANTQSQQDLVARL